MRIALFSDVHGNWTALQEVWTGIQHEGGFDAVVCAGDLACFRPHPEECLELLQQQKIACVMGNCDLLVLGEGEPSEAAVKRMPHLSAQIAWCGERLSDSSRTFLRSLPHTLRFPGGTGDLLICHATPTTLDGVCAPTASDAEWVATMGSFEGAAIAFGHVHVPAIRTIDQKLYVNVAHCGLGAPEYVGYTILTDRRGGWEAERRPVPHDRNAERGYAISVGFPGAEVEPGF
jgi:predicted phosphodiesterase